MDFPNGLTSDDYAVLLGLKQPDGVIMWNGSSIDESERLQILMTFNERIDTESEPQREIIWSRFCALYLPELVSRFLDPPPPHATDEEFTRNYPLYNAYLKMFIRIIDSPYFMKYLRSNKPIAAPGKRLPSVLARRLINLAPHFDLRMRFPIPDYPANFYSSILCANAMLLSMLLVVFVKVPNQDGIINTDIRQGLSLWLMKWGRRYSSARSSDPRLAQWCGRALSLLRPNIDVKDEAKLLRRQFKHVSECALPGCAVKDNCKTCSKCKTASYCSIEHQRAHWNFPIGAPHRELCHETQY